MLIFNMNQLWISNSKRTTSFISMKVELVQLKKSAGVHPVSLSHVLYAFPKEPDGQFCTATEPYKVRSNQTPPSKFRGQAS